MQQPNILLIISDEHDAAAAGCYGHRFVRTPNLDRLSDQGLTFDNAYCNSPMCVPSRMSFLAGQYGFEIDVWDNGSPLRSEIPSFGTYLTAAGYDTTLCGRMHMIGPDRTHGFGVRLYDDMTKWQSFQQKACRTPEWRRGSNSHVTECGPGDGSWLQYDSTVKELAVQFLRARARQEAGGTSGRPWLLVTGFMYPHFPLICPQRFFDMYYPNNVQLPVTAGQELENQHPAVQHLRRSFHNDRPLPEDLQRRALASYYGLITLLDQYVGQIVAEVDSSDLRNNTAIIYTSDHGEMGGQHGIWQKQCFYEAAVRVPLVVRLPDSRNRPGVHLETAVSLVDIAPTLLDLATLPPPDAMRGSSLLSFVTDDSVRERPIFSEYHAQGMLSAAFMLKKGSYKYNYYVGHRPELYCTAADPEEMTDLIDDPAMEPKIAELDEELHSIVDPEGADRRAKENQKREGLARAY